MKLNSEQQEFFDLGVELYELYESEELKNTNPFFAATRMRLYKSVLSLAVSYDILNKDAIVRYEEFGDYEELLNTLPENHLARSYFDGIQNLSPGMRMSIKCDFKVTMQHFWGLIEEAFEQMQK
ncbi:hypothetical protein ACQVPJ_28750 [Bacillus mycoides]|uniref:hypothetical protein n=1 Tax=Bacillus mycoides TaxID=1405 RepID=UPI003D659BBE